LKKKNIPPFRPLKNGLLHQGLTWRVIQDINTRRGV
jgi:hypothetical protein